MSDNICKMNEELANKLVGKLATLADASIASDRQVKFFKDSIKNIVWDIEKERAERTGMKEFFAEGKN